MMAQDEPVLVKDEPEVVHEEPIPAQQEEQSSQSQVPEPDMATESFMPKSQEVEEAPKVEDVSAPMVEVSAEVVPKESSDNVMATPTKASEGLSAPDINIIPSTPLATSPNVVTQQEEEEEEKKEEAEKKVEA